MQRESYLYKKFKNGSAQCHTCAHHCLLKKQETGKCGARKNIGGIIYTLNYGQTPGMSIDPIEKKPLYHFLPGSQTMSFNAHGCNFKCQHCQNAWTSQIKVRVKNPQPRFAKRGGQELGIKDRELWGEEISPKEIVQAAVGNNCLSISYTYTEPTVFLEYAFDTMKLAKEKNLKNIWVSNGYMSEETLNLIAPYLDAINIDLKSFSEKFYQKICGARLKPVLDNLIKIKQRKIHLEVTTLIIPGLNDSAKELGQIAKFIKDKLGADTPWHVSAFYPAHKLKYLSPTPAVKILEAQEIGLKAGLKFVYAGNI